MSQALPQIDWITAIIPCPHTRADVDEGVMMWLDPHGEIKRRFEPPRKVRGSYESGVHISTWDQDWRYSPGSSQGPPRREYLRIDGNPSKWFLGHNCWGPGGADSIQAFLWSVLLAAGFHPDDSDFSGRLTRIDITRSFRAGVDDSDAEAWVRACEATAALKYRGRGNMSRGCTLYYGKNSRRWTLKIYPKGREISQPGRRISDLVPRHEEVAAWARGVVRFEVTLRGQEFDRLGLRAVSDWTDDHLISVWDEKMSGLDLRAVSDRVIVGDLPRPVRTTYVAWESGADLVNLLPRSTWYRHRRMLLPYGVDISIPRLSDQPARPLLAPVVCRPCRVPDWAERPMGLRLAA